MEIEAISGNSSARMSLFNAKNVASSKGIEQAGNAGGLFSIDGNEESEETKEYDPLDLNKDGIVDESERMQGENLSSSFQSTQDFLSLLTMVM